jgi:large subunit ribosomal protein L15
LNVFEDGSVITVDTLLERGVISKKQDGVKILGNGDITKKLTVRVNMFSKSAAEKIVAAGGKAEVV